jgi:hypothetical protein
MTEAEASKRHAKGEQYMAFWGDPAKPECAVLLVRNLIKAMWFDGCLRPYEIVFFRRESSKRFRLTDTHFRRYRGDEFVQLYFLEMHFEPTGEVAVREWFVAEGTQRDGRGLIRMDDFYVDPPEFGHYDEYLKFAPGGAFRPKLDLPRA